MNYAKFCCGVYGIITESITHTELHYIFTTTMKHKEKLNNHSLTRTHTEVPSLTLPSYVTVPPEILDEETSTDVEVKEDAPAQLRCGAKGYPAPEITFMKEGSGQVRYATKGLPGAVGE